MPGPHAGRPHAIARPLAPQLAWGPNPAPPAPAPTQGGQEPQPQPPGALRQQEPEPRAVQDQEPQPCVRRLPPPAAAPPLSQPGRQRGLRPVRPVAACCVPCPGLRASVLRLRAPARLAAPGCRHSPPPGLPPCAFASRRRVQGGGPGNVPHTPCCPQRRLLLPLCHTRLLWLPTGLLFPNSPAAGDSRSPRREGSSPRRERSRSPARAGGGPGGEWRVRTCWPAASACLPVCLLHSCICWLPTPAEQRAPVDLVPAAPAVLRPLRRRRKSWSASLRRGTCASRRSTRCCWRTLRVSAGCLAADRLAGSDWLALTGWL